VIFANKNVLSISNKHLGKVCGPYERKIRGFFVFLIGNPATKNKVTVLCQSWTSAEIFPGGATSTFCLPYLFDCKPRLM